MGFCSDRVTYKWARRAVASDIGAVIEWDLHGDRILPHRGYDLRTVSRTLPPFEVNIQCDPVCNNRQSRRGHGVRFQVPCSSAVGPDSGGKSKVDPIVCLSKDQCYTSCFHLLKNIMFLDTEKGVDSSGFCVVFLFFGSASSKTLLFAQKNLIKIFDKIYFY